MADGKKHYARYAFIRGNQALWNGDPSEKGAQFRQVVIASDEWMSDSGSFQVYALEGISNGIIEGKLSPGLNPTVLFDGDFEGFQAAAERFDQIVTDAEARGFKKRSFIDEIEFEAKLRDSARK